MSSEIPGHGLKSNMKMLLRQKLLIVPLLLINTTWLHVSSRHIQFRSALKSSRKLMAFLFWRPKIVSTNNYLNSKYFLHSPQPSVTVEGYSLSVFMSPAPLSWWRLLLSVTVLMIGMLWLAGAEVCAGAGARSSSESLPLELSSLLDDDELLESEELSPLLSWSMTRASAISSAQAYVTKLCSATSRDGASASDRRSTFSWEETTRHLVQCHPLEMPGMFSLWGENFWSWWRTCFCRCCY